MTPSRLHFRGDAPQLNSPFLDRRASPRREVRSPGARLLWSSQREDLSADVHVVNLSRGGAGLLVREVPAEDAIVRLVLSSIGGAVVEGWVVGTRESTFEGWTFLHMRFSHPCPDSALERLLAHATAAG